MPNQLAGQYDSERYTQLSEELTDLDRRINKADGRGAHLGELIERRRAVKREIALLLDGNLS